MNLSCWQVERILRAKKKKKNDVVLVLLFLPHFPPLQSQRSSSYMPK